jgi:hypothetical protein
MLFSKCSPILFGGCKEVFYYLPKCFKKFHFSFFLAAFFFGVGLPFTDAD